MRKAPFREEGGLFYVSGSRGTGVKSQSSGRAVTASSSW